MSKAEPRHYQRRAKRDVKKAWANGHRAVLLVSPTGSGKTFMAVHILERERILWVAHRRELVLQAKEELERDVGRGSVGVIMSGEPEHPSRRIQVASLDTILRRKAPSNIDVLVVDEAHHVMADTYRSLVSLYPESRLLGMTATPERDDGRPLGDVFDTLVPAASYSELIENGDLVPVEVVRPHKRLTKTFGMDPVASWMEYAGGRSAFVFVQEVKNGAHVYARRFVSEARVRAEVIEAKTGTAWRDDLMDQFRKGRIDVICSVNTLTEGVDVPTAQVAVSTRPFEFSGAMLQCFGRVMRPAPGKDRALIIDGTGATHIHGLPSEDRTYSLTSDAPIKRRSEGEEETVEGKGKRKRALDEDVEVEVATLGEEPKFAKGLRWARPSKKRAAVQDHKLRAIKRKRGRRAMEYVMDYYDSME